MAEMQQFQDLPAEVLAHIIVYLPISSQLKMRGVSLSFQYLFSTTLSEFYVHEVLASRLAVDWLSGTISTAHIRYRRMVSTAPHDAMKNEDGTGQYDRVVRNIGGSVSSTSAISSGNNSSSFSSENISSRMMEPIPWFLNEFEMVRFLKTIDVHLLSVIALLDTLLHGTAEKNNEHISDVVICWKKSSRFGECVPKCCEYLKNVMTTATTITNTTENKKRSIGELGGKKGILPDDAERGEILARQESQGGTNFIADLGCLSSDALLKCAKTPTHKLTARFRSDQSFLLVFCPQGCVPGRPSHSQLEFILQGVEELGRSKRFNATPSIATVAPLTEVHHEERKEEQRMEAKGEGKHNDEDDDKSNSKKVDFEGRKDDVESAQTNSVESLTHPSGALSKQKRHVTSKKKKGLLSANIEGDEENPSTEKDSKNENVTLSSSSTSISTSTGESSHHQRATPSSLSKRKKSYRDVLFVLNADHSRYIDLIDQTQDQLFGGGSGEMNLSVKTSDLLMQRWKKTATLVDAGQVHVIFDGVKEAAHFLQKLFGGYPIEKKESSPTLSWSLKNNAKRKQNDGDGDDSTLIAHLTQAFSVLQSQQQGGLPSTFSPNQQPVVVQSQGVGSDGRYVPAVYPSSSGVGQQQLLADNQQMSPLDNSKIEGENLGSASSSANGDVKKTPANQKSNNTANTIKFSIVFAESFARSISGDFVGLCNIRSLSLSHLPELLQIPEEFFACCQDLTAVEVLNCPQLQVIGKEFCTQCPQLISVTLLNLPLLVSIGEFFLRHCNALESVDIRDLPSLQSVAPGFCRDCMQLRVVQLSQLPSFHVIGPEFGFGCPRIQKCVQADLPKLKKVGARFLEM